MIEMVWWVITASHGMGRARESDATECVVDLHSLSEIIIFNSILTTFEASAIIWGSWGSCWNMLEPKTKPWLRILTKLRLSKSVMCTVAKGIEARSIAQKDISYRQIQSNSVITNSRGPLKNVRYNRETL